MNLRTDEAIRPPASADTIYTHVEEAALLSATDIVRNYALDWAG
jgi:hypothetical protein